MDVRGTAASYVRQRSAIPTDFARTTLDKAFSRQGVSKALSGRRTPAPARHEMPTFGRRTRRSEVRLSLLAALLLALSTAASSAGRASGPTGPPDLERLATGRLGPGPAGWISYCLSRPADCLDASPAARVVWSGAMVGLVTRVQREVNAAIVPAPEPASRDLWTVGPRVGDCEDFALTKRAALRAAGLPAGALRLATAYTEVGEYHTVLTVQTERGAVVLDNRFAEVRPLADLPYRWVMVELPDRPLAWAHL